MTAVLVVGCSLLGLVVGWLLDPVITRVPRKQPVFGPPAGRRTRRRRSPGRVFVTVLTGALFGATAARFDDSWLLPAYLVLTGALVALAVIDLETYLLPNRIVYPLDRRRCWRCSPSAPPPTATSTTTCAGSLAGRRSRSRSSSCSTWSRRAAWASAT